MTEPVKGMVEAKTAQAGTAEAKTAAPGAKDNVAGGQPPVRRPPKRDSRLKRWGKVLVVIAVFYAGWLIGWELLARSNLWPSYIFPHAIPVLQNIWENFGNGKYPEAIAASLRRLAIGYLAALGIGLGFGILMGRYKTAQITVGSVALGLQALPSIAWLPLALIWFGLDESAIIFVIIMGVVFSFAMATSTGIRSIPPQLERAARNLGARGESMVFDLVLPASLPQIVSGMKQGWSFAWRALIAAEMVYSTVGLGHMLWVGREFNDLTMVLAVMVVIVLVGLAADQLVFERLERAVHARWGVARR
jgi:NitT/TauT family transport system permease protein